MFLKHRGKVFESECEQLNSLMESNKHKHIDVLKMDIEGAAPPILNHMLDNKIYPNQIVAEFERPNRGNVREFFDFYRTLEDLHVLLLNPLMDEDFFSLHLYLQMPIQIFHWHIILENLVVLHLPLG